MPTTHAGMLLLVLYCIIIVVAGGLTHNTDVTAPISGFSMFAGIDITGANDGAFGGLCENVHFYATASKALWRTPSAVCDLLGCPRFGLRAGAKSMAGPYCIKGWVTNTSVNSFLSQTTCGVGPDNGSVIAATTVNGSCNDPAARYTVCPHGGGDTRFLARTTKGSSAAAIAAACRANKQCVGFVSPSGGSAGDTGMLLQYGSGESLYANYSTYTRIPR
jgi:hypothetical protein